MRRDLFAVSSDFPHRTEMKGRNEGELLYVTTL